MYSAPLRLESIEARHDVSFSSAISLCHFRFAPDTLDGVVITGYVIVCVVAAMFLQKWRSVSLAKSRTSTEV